MRVEQIAVFFENRSGRLAEIAGLLASNDINIRVLSLTDTSDFGILRLIVNDTEKTKQVLKNNGYTVGTSGVVVAEVADRPGGLAGVFQVVKESKLDVKYLYAFTQKSGETALVVFQFDDTNAAVEKLTKAGVRLLTGEEVYEI